jgi:hypothetical protein
MGHHIIWFCFRNVHHLCTSYMVERLEPICQIGKVGHPNGQLLSFLFHSFSQGITIILQFLYHHTKLNAIDFLIPLPLLLWNYNTILSSFNLLAIYCYALSCWQCVQGTSLLYLMDWDLGRTLRKKCHVVKLRA